MPETDVTAKLSGRHSIPDQSENRVPHGKAAETGYSALHVHNCFRGFSSDKLVNDIGLTLTWKQVKYWGLAGVYRSTDVPWLSQY